MGSGKTTIGRKLASLAGWKFFDLDSEIEKEEKKSITEIFSEYGEEYFRNTEAEILRALHPKTDAVIAAGGGTPCFHGNIKYMLSTGIVIYLKMTPRQIKKRIEPEKAIRPLIKDIPDSRLEGFIAEKLKEREKYYNLAHIKINGLNPDISELLDKIQKTEF